MEIRDPRDDDFASIAAITNHYIATTAIHFGYEPVTADELCTSWRDHRERFPYLIAAEGERVIGYAKAGVWRERAAYAWTTEVTVYVAPDAHRGGIGRALYTQLFAELAQRKFHSAIAGITLPNDPSVAFHLAFGFESVGVVREAGFKHGTWHDIQFLQRWITAAAS